MDLSILFLLCYLLIKTTTTHCHILGSRGGDYEDCRLRKCDVLSSKMVPKLRCNFLSPSSEYMEIQYQDYTLISLKLHVVDLYWKAILKSLTPQNNPP